MSNFEQGPEQGPGQLPGVPPAYPQGYGYGYAPKTNTSAIISLVTGICAIFICPLTGIVGLITGFKARREIRESNGTETGDGLAVGGIITSLIGIVVVGMAFAAILAVTMLGSSASSKFESVASAIS